MSEINSFSQIAPYLEDPLVLIGFFIFLVFLFLRVLVKKGIIPTLTQGDGFSFLKLLLLYGFIFGIVLVVLGFALKHREMTKKEQYNLVNQLDTELEKNLKTLNELKLNTENLLEKNITLSQVLRTDGIDLLTIMFPRVVLDLDTQVNVIDIANSQFNYIINNKLHENELQMNRLDEAGKTIKEVIERTLPIINSLADLENKRYIIDNSIWNANIETYRKVDVVDVTKFQEIYTEMQLVRNDYGVIANSCINFHKSVANFFDPKEQMNKQKLASVLSSERNSYEFIHDYSLNIYHAIDTTYKLSSFIKN